MSQVVKPQQINSRKKKQTKKPKKNQGLSTEKMRLASKCVHICFCYNGVLSLSSWKATPSLRLPSCNEKIVAVSSL